MALRAGNAASFAASGQSPNFRFGYGIHETPQVGTHCGEARRFLHDLPFAFRQPICHIEVVGLWLNRLIFQGLEVVENEGLDTLATTAARSLLRVWAGQQE